MKQLINQYLDSKSLAWSKSTLRSEGYRLNAIREVLDGNPHHLWDFLERKQAKPYSRVTTWSRVVSFWDWCIKEGHRDGQNRYKQFKQNNSRLFRNTYVRRTPGISSAEADSRIQQITDPKVQEKARQLLRTGMRYSESFTLKDSIVVGKGGKRRRVFSNGLRRCGFRKSYDTFRRQLADVELKPHDLRKIFLNEAVKKGANVFELCALAGWSNLNTAQSYIQADEDRLKHLVEQINDQSVCK